MSNETVPIAAAATAPQRLLWHTVGREQERNELRAAFNAAKAGRGSLLCVAGEPGIGKTTLVEDFLAELAADNQVHDCARAMFGTTGGNGSLPAVARSAGKAASGRYREPVAGGFSRRCDAPARADLVRAGRAAVR